MAAAKLCRNWGISRRSRSHFAFNGLKCNEPVGTRLQIPDFALPSFVRELTRRLFANPWLLLTLTCLFWGGNVIAARTAIDNISPISLVTGRWAITCAILFLTSRHAFVADIPVMRPHLWRIVLGAVCGFGIYHSLYYVSAHYTTGVNLSILQGVTPIFVFLGAWLLWRTRVTAWQAIGCAMTILGILIIGTQGDLSALRDLRFNIGDIGILFASACYAAYSLKIGRAHV